MAKGGFRGMPGGMNQAAMMKQAQKMQQEMLRMQEEMENKTYSATTGGGMVTATVNGKHEVLDLKINPEAVDPDDVEMLQDMVIAAVNEAMRSESGRPVLRRHHAVFSCRVTGVGGSVCEASRHWR